MIVNLEAGKLRAIGISNYNICHLEEMFDYVTVLPAVNQCSFCRNHIYPKKTNT
jgi:diketogulonate reductase-like aldo/keto reductase